MAAVVIVEYDPAWPSRFASLAATVSAALGPVVLRVEHVGSTAVPGLPAKPVIDLDAVVRPADVLEAIGRLAAIGYIHLGGRCGRARGVRPACRCVAAPLVRLPLRQPGVGGTLAIPGRPPRRTCNSRTNTGVSSASWPCGIVATGTGTARPRRTSSERPSRGGPSMSDPRSGGPGPPSVISLESAPVPGGPGR